jgi:hypothetical protein
MGVLCFQNPAVARLQVLFSEHSLRISASLMSALIRSVIVALRLSEQKPAKLHLFWLAKNGQANSFA